MQNDKHIKALRKVFDDTKGLDDTPYKAQLMSSIADDLFEYIDMKSDRKQYVEELIHRGDWFLLGYQLSKFR